MFKINKLQANSLTVLSVLFTLGANHMEGPCGKTELRRELKKKNNTLSPSLNFAGYKSNKRMKICLPTLSFSPALEMLGQFSKDLAVPVFGKQINPPTHFLKVLC